MVAGGRRTWGETMGHAFIVLFITLFSFSVLIPFIRHFSISISTAKVIYRGGFTILPTPGEITFHSYQRILRARSTVKAYFWSSYRTVLGTALSVFFTAMTAYPLSKRYCPFRTGITAFWLIPMFFSGGIIPLFMLVRSLGMINTIASLIVPGLIPIFTMLIARNFFMTLPESLTETARLDGAHDLYIYLRIVLPLSTPIIATMALWQLVAHWNAWFDIMVYFTKTDKLFVQQLLRRIIEDALAAKRGGLATEIRMMQLAEQEEYSSLYTAETIQSAILLVSIIPILCVYPFLQKYFAKGILIGSLKG